MGDELDLTCVWPLMDEVGLSFEREFVQQVLSDRANRIAALEAGLAEAQRERLNTVGICQEEVKDVRAENARLQRRLDEATKIIQQDHGARCVCVYCEEDKQDG